MSREIELKLAFPPEALGLIRRHPLIMATTPKGRAQTLENTYYDTPELTLGKSLIAVRTRRIGRRWLQTIKSANSSAGGLSSRPEWEQAYDTRARRFDFSPVDDPQTRRMLEENADSIGPLFTTTFRRETREYAPRPGVSILLMIDSGSVRLGAAGDTSEDVREEPISELELELVEGTADDLLDYALQLGRDLPLMPEDISKAQRGYQLLANEPARATRSGKVALASSMGLREAFLSLAFDCLHGWQANALGALHHADPDFIHQLRIALRRLRTLLRVFADHLPAGFADEWQLQLGELANLIGEARDLDVMHDSLLREPLENADAPDAAALLGRLQQASDEARQHARQALHSSHARVMLLQFSQALHKLAQADSTNGDLPSLQHFVRRGMSRLDKQVHKRLRLAEETGDAAHLHRLRIALKRLRYSHEFFASLMDAKASKRYSRALTKVLRCLGELNDIAVGGSRLRSWADESAALNEAATWVLAWHAGQGKKRAAKALKAAARLLDAPAPWKRFRNVQAAE